RDRGGARGRLRLGARAAAPHDLAGEAELVEERRVVAGDARGKDVLLPGADRRLDAGEGLDDRQEPGDPVELRARRGVLPARQEAVEVGRADRLDGAAQPPERQAVDARQEAPVAPLLLGASGREAPAQDETLALEAGAAVGDVEGVEL